MPVSGVGRSIDLSGNRRVRIMLVRFVKVVLGATMFGIGGWMLLSGMLMIGAILAAMGIGMVFDGYEV